jgi:DNA-binding response OmpR family regulator
MTRILIVEDEHAIALGLRNDLVLEGYEVEVAATGDAGAARARETAFDLILLDVMLPGKDGFTVCRELRRSGVKTPIILLTARAQETEKVHGLEIGADDYITKPFSPMELRARIKAVLRRTVGGEQEVYRFGVITVDFARCLALRDGVDVCLTPLEFKLLATLIRSRGRLLSRNQLIDAVWGAGTAITDRVVDNHVMNLRRKLEDQPAEPRYLLSSRGLGYRFENPDGVQTNS